MNHFSAVGHSAPPSATPADAGSLRAVHRAIGESRRGVPVIMRGMLAAGSDSRAADDRLLMVPAETASEESLAVFAQAMRGEPFLLLSASRAARGAEAPGVTSLPVATLTVAALRALADPARGMAGAGASTHALPADIDPAAAVALVKLARLLPAALVARVHPGEVSGLLDVAAGEVLAYPADAAAALVRIAEASVPMAEAPDARVVAFRPPDGGIEHLAILIGRPEDAEAPLVRIHSECFTGDLLGSLRCDCGPQLHQAFRRMNAEGAGVVLYMAQEGRGIGLVNKLRAYRLQDAGLDTLDANRALGFEADERSFAPAATMLKSLGLPRIRLLTNNPDKILGLQSCGIDVAGRVSHAIAANGVNDEYLETKARRFGHLIG
jgi:GTP cyclohydrolase II